MLELLALIFDTGCCVLIWMVQLVVYPGFHYYPAQPLLQWHKKYTALVTLIVLPLMLGQLTTGGLQLIFEFSGFHLLKFLLILITWILTFMVFVPLHRALEGSVDVQPVIRKLVVKNWSRTLLWTLIFGITVVEVWVRY